MPPQTIFGALDAPEDPLEFLVGQLVPTNKLAQRAIQALSNDTSDAEDHHRKFLGQTLYDGAESTCFDFRLDIPTQFFKRGWRVGAGRSTLGRTKGVDILLLGTSKCGVAGTHGRFCFLQGADGFFVNADNARGKRIIMNGTPITNDMRKIPFENAIQIGECCFTFLYPDRSTEGEIRFQEKLTIYKKTAMEELEPLTLPTPRGSEARIGHWLIQYKLNKGAFGEVFMCTHSVRGEPAAVKRLLRKQKTGQDFMNELKMTKLIMTFKHERIASPIEILEEDKIPKIEIDRMKLLLGSDWTSFTDSEAFFIVSPIALINLRWTYLSSRVGHDDSVEFFGQALLGVQFLHANGIIHNDMKPDNILVDSLDPPSCRITDFGCATDQAVVVFAGAGTERYWAPEQIPGETFSQAVDVWAVGLIGMEMITKILKCRVTDGIPIQDVLRELRRSPSCIAPVCEAMLHLSPESRITVSEARARFLAATASLRKKRRQPPIAEIDR